MQEVVLTIDRDVFYADPRGGPGDRSDLPGITVAVTGPGDYASTVVTGADGATLSDLRFSTEADPYIVSVSAGAGVRAGADERDTCPRRAQSGVCSRHGRAVECDDHYHTMSCHHHHGASTTTTAAGTAA